jgi:hypothetical protein
MHRHELAIVLLRDWRTALALLVLVYGTSLLLVHTLFSPARSAKKAQRAGAVSVDVDQARHPARVT